MKHKLDANKEEKEMNANATPFVQTYFHGTKADLKIGDLIEVGYTSNYGENKSSKYINDITE